MTIFSWLSFFKMGLLIGGGYLLLRLIKYLIERFADDRANLVAAKETIRLLLIGYEPLALIILSVVFIFINPPFHGTLWLICILFGFNSIRNYMIGRLFQIDTNIEAGKRVKIGNIKGLITKMSNRGIYIQNSEGLHFMGYSQPFREGYSALSSDEIGGFYTLRITPRVQQNLTQQLNIIEDLLVTVPYLDSYHLPELQEVHEQGATFVKCSILLKENSYLSDFELLVSEWGYDCDVLEDFS